MCWAFFCLLSVWFLVYVRRPQTEAACCLQQLLDARTDEQVRTETSQTKQKKAAKAKSYRDCKSA